MNDQVNKIHVKKWKVRTMAKGVVLTLNDQEYDLGFSGHAIAFDIDRAVRGLNAPEAEHEANVLQSFAEIRSRLAEGPDPTQDERKPDLVTFVDVIGAIQAARAGKHVLSEHGNVPFTKNDRGAVVWLDTQVPVLTLNITTRYIVLPEVVTVKLKVGTWPWAVWRHSCGATLKRRRDDHAYVWWHADMLSSGDPVADSKATNWEEDG